MSTFCKKNLKMGSGFESQVAHPRLEPPPPKKKIDQNPPTRKKDNNG